MYKMNENIIKKSIPNVNIKIKFERILPTAKTVRKGMNAPVN